MIENVEAVENSLGLEKGILSKAIENTENVTIELPKGKFIDPETHVIRSNEDQETFLNNIKTEQKTAGVEIAVKEMRNKLEYNFEGKTIENLLTAHGEKVLKDAGTEPDKKIEELNIDLSKLRGNNTNLQDQLDEMVKNTSLKDNQRKVDGNILSNIGDNLTLSKEQVMTLFKSEHQVVEEDGKFVVKKGGETMKDDNREPLNLKTILESFTTDFVKTAEGGSGGGDTTDGGKAGSLEAFTKRQIDLGNNVGSEKFNIAMNKELADGTLKI